MARRPTPVEESIDQTDGVNSAVPVDAEDQNDQPMYQVYPDAKIPVSKKMGVLWKSRYDTGKAKMKSNGSYEAWDEAIKYYKNDQTGKKNRDNADLPGTSESDAVTGGRNTNTENVVFSNISAMVPSIYAKNPDVTVHTNKGDEDRAFTTCAQKLVRVLMQRRTYPGANLKPKMRRAVVMTTLTNISFIEVGYTKREQSSDKAMAEIDALAEQYRKAKDKKEILEIEGKLAAMEEKVDLLLPSGPWTAFRHPKDVVVDPDATLTDGTDSKWVMIREVYETSFLNAVYRKKDEDGKWTSLYEPTHVLKSNAEGSTNMAGHDMDITNFQLIKEGQTWKDFGFDSEDAYKRAGRTFVWKVWDRTTRRVLLFAENDWAWPIWVWDDPYGLDDFYPLSPLAFHTDPEDLYARGEVSYYLDQQDEINAINSMVSRLRNRVANMLIYDKSKITDEEDVRKLVRPVTSETLLGVKVPEGMEIAKMIVAPPVPQIDYAQLFDKKSLFEAVDRVSGVPSVVKGVEFRTNTTNKAIDSYESTSALRLDEKIDAIEECVGRVGYMMLVMALVNMTKEEVTELIGQEEGQAWPGPMSPKDAQRRFSLTVTGGSSLKPTSKVRKEQAKELGQIFGQFGKDNPAMVLMIIKMFARAYSDELVLEDSDWKLILTQVQGQMQATAQAAQPQPPAGAQQGGGPAGGMDPKQIVKMVGDMFAKMPPDVRQGVGQDIAKGIPLEQILMKLQNTAGQDQRDAHAEAQKGMPQRPQPRRAA
jgi:hypothetical protein